MKNKKRIFATLTLSTSLLVSGMLTNVQATTYLSTNQNYYQSGTIDKGFLDQVISATTVQGNTPAVKQAVYDALVQAAAQGKVIYTTGMTFNEFFLANNLSPEDNFSTYASGSGVVQKVSFLNSSNIINSRSDAKSLSSGYGVTYVGPTDYTGTYWGSKASVPVTFSRLTVGLLADVSPTRNVYPATTGLKHFSRDSYVFPTLLGYGEANTVNDYMLTEENDFVIPTRYNTLRDDVYLTMRSRGSFASNIDGARAYLSAKLNGQDVPSKATSPNFYLNSTTSFFLTPMSYEQLGTWGRMAVNFGTFESVSQSQLTDIGVYEFSNKVNSGIAQFESSNGRSIVSGFGGQIQLTGFYRQSDIDGDTITDEMKNFAVTSTQRKTDSVNSIDVNYFMYSSNAQFSERPAVDTTTYTGVPAGAKLISPNITTYQIEVTRPYFSAFEGREVVTETQLTEPNFNTLLGEQSFLLNDEGIAKDGNEIGVDISRVRVRISKDNGVTFESTALSLNELKATLLESSTYVGQTLVLAYTYSATDAQDENIGKLPNEITNNTGAYAIPFTRKVTIPTLKTTRYVDEENNTIATEVIDRVFQDSKTIEGYSFKETTTTGDVRVHVYTKNKPVVTNGKLIVSYVDENNNSLTDVYEVTGTVGSNYETNAKNFDGYELVRVVGREKGVFIDGELTLTYVYRPIQKDIVPNKVENSNQLPQTGTQVSQFGLSAGLLLLLSAFILRKKEK